MLEKQYEYVHHRGEIKESAVKALVTDKLFRCRVEKNKKGKGSYRRNAKHRKGENPFKSVQCAFLNGFSFFTIFL